MFILTEDLEIIPENIYNEDEHGKEINVHDSFQEAENALINELAKHASYE